MVRELSLLIVWPNNWLGEYLKKHKECFVFERQLRAGKTVTLLSRYKNLFSSEFNKFWINKHALFEL